MCNRISYMFKGSTTYVVLGLKNDYYTPCNYTHTNFNCLANVGYEKNGNAGCPALYSPRIPVGIFNRIV